MKKTLHGKRHLRARAIIAVTRERKRTKKLIRDMIIFQHFIDQQLPDVMADVVDALIKMRDAFMAAAPLFISAAHKVRDEILEVQRVLAANRAPRVCSLDYDTREG